MLQTCLQLTWLPCTVDGWRMSSQIHISRSVCVHRCTKMSFCAFLSLLSFYIILLSSLYPFYHHFFLHLSILAPVGIGKRCSNLSSMTFPPSWQPVSNSLSHSECMIPQATSWCFFKAWVTCHDITAANRAPDTEIQQRGNQNKQIN